MNTTTKIKKLDSLTLADSPQTGVFMGLSRTDEVAPSRLYLVTMTRKFQGKYPIVTSAYCIAPSGEEAFEQVVCNCFPELDYVSLKLQAEVEFTAAEIPVHIRGWGRQTF